MAPRKKLPATEQDIKAVPNAEQQQKEIPAASMAHREKPQIGSPENTVTIGGQLIEIKPTKLKYQRNRTALFYRILELYPLPAVLAMEAGTFGDDRDGDKALMDWLIAVTDNPDLIIENYDEIDTETIEKLLLIFRRLNRIDEKEARQKNAEKERKEAV